MYIVYFIESRQHKNRRYIGFTANLKQRLSHHNNGRVKSTARFAPWKLIYAEAYINKHDAIGRERFLKSGSGWKFLKKQIKHYLTSAK